MAVIQAGWTCLASSDRLKRSSQSLSVISSSNRALIFGGELLPRQPIDNNIDIINLSGSDNVTTETLPAPNEAPSPRVGMASTVLNDNVFLFSGRGGVSMAPVEEHGALWKYDISTSKWILIKPVDSAAPYPAARSYHTMTNDRENLIYVHAGCPEKGRLSDLWEFNLTTRAWQQLHSAPDPPRGGTSITYHGQKLYRMNGFDGQTEQGGSLDVYDIPTKTWSSITYSTDGEEGPGARSVSVLLALRVLGKDSLVTLFGEHDPSSLGHAGAGKMLDDAWLFDINSQKWTQIQAKGKTPSPRGWFDAQVYLNRAGEDQIVVHGGLAEDNSRLGDVWLMTIN